MQPGLFTQLMKKLLEHVHRVSGDIERKTCAVGMTKLICETPEVQTGHFELWPLLLTSLVRLFEMGEGSGDDDEGQDEENVVGGRCDVLWHIALSPWLWGVAASSTALVRDRPGRHRLHQGMSSERLWCLATGAAVPSAGVACRSHLC